MIHHVRGSGRHACCLVVVITSGCYYSRASLGGPLNCIVAYTACTARHENGLSSNITIRKDAAVRRHRRYAQARADFETRVVGKSRCAAVVDSHVLCC